MFDSQFWAHTSIIRTFKITRPWDNLQDNPLSVDQMLDPWIKIGGSWVTRAIAFSHCTIRKTYFWRWIWCCFQNFFLIVKNGLFFGPICFNSVKNLGSMEHDLSRRFLTENSEFWKCCSERMNSKKCYISRISSFILINLLREQKKCWILVFSRWNNFTLRTKYAILPL